MKKIIIEKVNKFINENNNSNELENLLNETYQYYNALGTSKEILKSSGSNTKLIEIHMIDYKKAINILEKELYKNDEVITEKVQKYVLDNYTERILYKEERKELLDYIKGEFARNKPFYNKKGKSLPNWLDKLNIKQDSVLHQNGCVDMFINKKQCLCKCDSCIRTDCLFM